MARARWTEEMPMTDGLSPKPRGRCGGGAFRGGPLGVNDAASGLPLQSIEENLQQIRCRWRDVQQSAQFMIAVRRATLEQ